MIIVLLNLKSGCDVEPQKVVPHCGSPVGTGGSGIKNFKCGTGRDSRKENAFPQNSRNCRTVRILSH